MDGLPENFCWQYQYEEEGHTGSVSPLGPILRPVVPIQLVGPTGRETNILMALVDSGCNSILTPEWVAMEIGIELTDRQTTTTALGGAVRRVRYEWITLRLSPPDELSDEKPVEWQTDVGFMKWDDPPWMVILGQRGFFDQFSVVMSRFSQRLAVRHVAHFDSEYG